MIEKKENQRLSQSPLRQFFRTNKNSIVKGNKKIPTYSVGVFLFIISKESNPFTYRVSASHISYTLEFKNLFLARYEAGESVREIFQSLGYDTEILGEILIYRFAHQLVKRAEPRELMREIPPSRRDDKPADINNTMLIQQSIEDIQQEITYLRSSCNCKKNYRTGQ